MTDADVAEAADAATLSGAPGRRATRNAALGVEYMAAGSAWTWVTTTACGLDAVRFTTPEQLRRDLVARGAPLRPA